jgi:hypothetical protein
MMTFTEPFRANVRVTFLLGCIQERRGSLSRPTPCRSTSFATTPLSFMVSVDPSCETEGAMSMRLTA